MKFKTSLWIAGIVTILALIPAGILFYQNQKLKNQISYFAGQIEVNHKKLSESLQRSETKQIENYEEINAFATRHKLDLKAIKNDLDSLGANLEAVASTEAKTTTVIYNNYPSDSSTNNPNSSDIPICKEDGRPIDIHSYTKRTETTKLSDSNGMRVADVSFSAAEKNPWNSKIYGIRYKILNTIGRGTKGQTILTTELLTQNLEVQPNEIFRIEGVESHVLQMPEPNPEFDWFDPSLYLLGNIGLEVYNNINFSLSIALGFSFWSYGRNWRFLGISAGYDGFRQAFRASFIPVLYNIGDPLPVFDSLFIGLDVGISHKADISVGFIIGTRL